MRRAAALIIEVPYVQVELPQRDGEYVPCPDKIRELMRHPAWRDCCRKINHAANYAATCVLPLAKHGGKGFHQPYGGYTDAEGERRECVLYLNGRAHHWPKPIQGMEVRSNLTMLCAR